MQCFICAQKLVEGFLCKKHSAELHKMLELRLGVIDNPKMTHHCLICGEYRDRIIIEYHSVGYFCGRDIEEENNRYD